MRIECRYRLTDEKARIIIKKIARVKNIQDIQDMDSERRDKIKEA